MNFYLTPYTKINSQWIKHMDIKPETIFLENIVGKVFNTDLDNKFLDLTPKAKARKAEINKWDFMK